MSKKQLQSEETKQRIVDAANALFAKKGYHAASLEEMAAASFCSKANIYYHFKSKEELFLHLSELYEKEWFEIWEEQKKAYSTISEQLYGVLDFATNHGFAHPLYRAACEFLDDSVRESSAVKKLIAAKIEKNRLFYEKLLEEGIDSGEFRPGNAKQYGIILEGMIRGISETTSGMDPRQALELYRTALNVLLYGIAEDRQGNTRK
ncbi:TetR/AcrR family transcriptional regulator [Paenibacillus sp. LHD-117]|uniref:TetR/AcrR family transcriptional regulator n=1 Tax=Paenibacillus sp. LHD-117 TaxID=3071412 RepID=UPI0027E0167A|nr:TetR/AcrR family transcriptional regulator [Paenibacillus sp. LHD-117]MDQ6420925.1 TetR/AcrR family transcriptional regulator [Paenibacillus sp. LHD-117]